MLANVATARRARARGFRVIGTGNHAILHVWSHFQAVGRISFRGGYGHGRVDKMPDDVRGERDRSRWSRSMPFPHRRVK
jgi:hypothetical protein